MKTTFFPSTFGSEALSSTCKKIIESGLINQNLSSYQSCQSNMPFEDVIPEWQSRPWWGLFWNCKFICHSNQNHVLFSEKKHNKTDASDISCLKQIILYSSFTLDIQKMVQCIAMQGSHNCKELSSYWTQVSLVNLFSLFWWQGRQSLVTCKVCVGWKSFCKPVSLI